MPRLTRYVSFPFRGAAAILVLTFTLGSWVALHAGLAGIPLGLLLVSWFFKYCFILFDAVVRGAEDSPVLSIEMVNPVDEQRPLAQAVLIAGAAVLAVELGRLTVPAVGWVSGMLLLVALPASIAVLGITGNPLRAAWPPEILGMMRGMAGDYALLLASIAGIAMLNTAIVRGGAPEWVSVAVAQFSLLLMFALVGGALFEHRLELGIEFRSTRERLAERAQREHASERHRVLDRAYAKFRVSEPQQGWQEIQSWLQLHGEAADPNNKLLPEYRAVLAGTARWDDLRAADRLTDDLVALYLARRETGRALEVVEERLASNPRYRPRDAAHATRLAELAAAAGKRTLRRQLAPDP